MMSFDNVIFIPNFDRKFDKRVVDNISPTSSQYYHNVLRRFKIDPMYFSFFLQTLLYAAIVLYAPTIALSSVTSLPWWASILVLGIRYKILFLGPYRQGAGAQNWTSFITLYKTNTL